MGWYSISSSFRAPSSLRLTRGVILRKKESNTKKERIIDKIL